MRTRDAARLLIFNSRNQVLLFRFRHDNGALAGRSYWATPGGGVEPGETFRQAAVRELFEETGIDIDVNQTGPAVAERSFEMTLPDGERVRAREKFYLLKTGDDDIRTSHWTDSEKAVIDDYRWWNLNDLRETDEVVFPPDIPDICSASD